MKKMRRKRLVEEVETVKQEVRKIGKDEVRKALKRTKKEKTIGPDYILVEVWKYLRLRTVEFSIQHD